MEVCQEELAGWEGLFQVLGRVFVVLRRVGLRTYFFKSLENRVGFALFGDFCVFDLSHGLDVLSKVTLEYGVNGGVIDGDQAVDYGGVS